MYHEKDLAAIKTKYSGKTVVVKYGGNAMTGKNAAISLMDNIVLLQSLGVQIVLVHGGGPEINAMLKKAGIESRFVNGLRYTDNESIHIVQMVLAGKVNKDLSLLLAQRGAKAIGVCGLDSGVIGAEKITTVDLGFVGQVKKINAKPLYDLMSMGYIPVVATVGSDEKGNVYNINADTAAGAIAVEMKAAAFVLLTDVAGILKDIEDAKSLIAKIDVRQARQYMEEKVIDGGMIPKAKCCIDAVNNGVDGAYIADGRKENIFISCLIEKEGCGTLFVENM